MSSTARAERRRTQRAASKAGRRLGHEYPHAFQIGWCADEPEAIEQLKRETHDGVLRLLGTRRRGGITWRILSGAEAVAGLELLVDGELSPAHLDYYRQLRACLREYGGVLVAATAPGAPPKGTKVTG